MSRNENINIHTWCTYRQISYLCIVRTISVIYESEYIHINSAFTCTYCIKTARHMFTLFVHEIVATLFKKTLVLVASLIETGKLFQSLHPLYITQVLYKLAFDFNCFNDTYFYLT